MGRAFGVEFWELVGELSKEPLAGVLESADTARVWNLSPGGATLKEGTRGGRGAAWCRRLFQF